MKRFSIACMVALALGLTGAPALGQQYQVDVHPPDGVYDTELTIGVGEEFCFDVYLTGAPEPDQPNAGGVWIEYNGSGSRVSYVSATATCPPWTCGFTQAINEPDGPGTFFSKLSNLGGAQISDKLHFLYGHCIQSGTSGVHQSHDMKVGQCLACVHDACGHAREGVLHTLHLACYHGGVIHVNGGACQAGDVLYRHTADAAFSVHHGSLEWGGQGTHPLHSIRSFACAA